ncbi:MAG TPA: pitrilysin family protein [Longimicrobiales bacterium]
MSIRWWGTAALSLAVLAPGASAQSAPPQIAFEEFTLDNGLRVIVHEDHSTPIVAVNVWYDVGSAHEQPGRSGFAHLFEHMLFQETENLEEGEVMRLIPAAGGEFNGTTNTDRTNYFEILPASRLNLSFWTHRERMAKLQVNAENFAREREVVKEERRRSYENRPYGEALGITLDTLMNDWAPYDHPTIGSMADLDAATVDDVREFYRRYYVPNNATIVVAGDVTVEQVRELAEQYFGDIPRGPEVRPLPEPTPTPRTDGERRVVIEDRLATLPLVAMGFNVPPHDHPDTYALELLSRIFSQGESSRLHRRLVKEEKAAVDAGSFFQSRLGPGFFAFFALPNQGIAPDRLEALIHDEIEKLQRDGVTARELAKAKNQLRAGQIMQHQTVFARTSSLQHYRRYHGDPAEINRDLGRYMAVTAEDIVRVARKYLTQANRTVMTVVPPRQASEAETASAPAAGIE